jgi:hypothetical protein
MVQYMHYYNDNDMAWLSVPSRRTARIACACSARPAQVVHAPAPRASSAPLLRMPRPRPHPPSSASFVAQKVRHGALLENRPFVDV